MTAGKVLMVAGALLLLLGLLLTLFPSIRPGRLPGDIVVRKGNWSLYFPLATSVIASLVLTLLFWLLNLIRK